MNEKRLLEKAHTVINLLVYEMSELQQRCFDLESKVRTLRDEIEDHWQRVDAGPTDRRGIH